MEKSKQNYEVFISFRGKDTRKNFTSHLYAALNRLKIKTYIDDRNLQSGDTISSALMKAIEGSKISVVVFSEHYADSSWCLDELVKIIECKKSDKQIVVPIFYDADPSTVRHQIGQYAKHFLKHEQRLKDNLQKVQNWRAALAEAANLSGWDCSVHRMESELVEKIANDLLQKLHGLRPDNDLEGEIAQRQEEAHLRSRDLNLRRDYNAMATALRIGQSQRQLGQSLLGLI